MILASGTLTKKRTIRFDVRILEKNRNNEMDFFPPTVTLKEGTFI